LPTATVFGALEESRTPNLPLRRRMLYPVELQRLNIFINNNMKLSELIRYKQDPAFASAVDLGTENDPGNTAYNKNAINPLINRLKELGWDNIGRGYEALVFSNPKKSYVVKLYIPFGNSKELLKFIVNNQSNKHIPKLKGKPVKIKSDSPVVMVRMEKLEPLKSINDPMFKQYYPPNTNGDLWDLLFTVDNNLLNWIKNNQPDLYQLIKFINNLPYELDLHNDNVMKRENTFVLIDL
jgi:hypothetical protein